MARISLNKETQRDIASIKEAARDLWADMRSPLFWVGLFILAVIMTAPWLLTANDLPW